MIKHLQLLELYLTTDYNIEKARKEMMYIYLRFLIVAEITALLSVTPIAFIASSGTLLWLILSSIHLVPRWKECKLKVMYYFLPLPIMLAVTAALMPVIAPVIKTLFDNFFIIARRPIMLIIPFVSAMVTYGLHNQEKYNTPRITVGKYACLIFTVLYCSVFAIENPLRSFFMRTILY